MAKATKAYLDFVIREYGFENDFDGEPDLPAAADLKRRFDEDQYRALYGIAFSDPEPWYSPSLTYLQKVASSLISSISRTPDLESVRHRVKIDYSQDISSLVRSVPFIPGSECVSRQWVFLVWERLLNVFREEVSWFDGSMELYLASKNSDLHAPGRIFFHLVENRGSETVGTYPFAFMATYSPEPDANGDPKPHLPLKYALTEYRSDSRKMVDLLSNLSRAADRSELISGLMESGELFYPLGFTADDAYRFLKEVPMYEECGILCRIPNWWRHRVNSALSMNIDSSGFMGAESLMSCVPEMYVDGTPVTEEELEDLLKQTDGLAMLKGKWVEIDRGRLQAMLDRIEALREEYGEGISFKEAFRMSLNPSDEEGEGLTVSNTEWVSKALGRIREDTDLEISDRFTGKLRPYQETGVRWLGQLSALGFGACLADDMGLGKTAQLLAFLVSRMREGQHALLIVPASLIANWQREIKKFTPSLENAVYDGTLYDVPLTITTYGMTARHPELSEPEWDYVILDEAQAIKNPGSKQSKAVRSLKAGFRVAMTGTPVENRLQDLWSLFDFLNSGLLGNSAEFEMLVKRLEANNSGYGRLRKMASPFILRRLKTDKSIISDLPDKLETTEMVSLSKKQIALYTKVLDEFTAAVESMDPKARLGLILSTITKFKQICNHPDQYLGQDAFSEKDSGKFAMLRDICESIAERREKVLVFTQYREMTEPLARFLEGVFGRKGLVFHGGMTKKARSDAVDMFNSEKSYVPFMVISIKAGGVGLNLTSANHVVHFDRWWNPAVENQATDRAFRIGQTKDVLVHKFVCKGTMEERIDALIQSKTELAQDVIGEGESWISKMDDGQLMELFSLER